MLIRFRLPYLFDERGSINFLSHRGRKTIKDCNKCTFKTYIWISQKIFTQELTIILRDNFIHAIQKLSSLVFICLPSLILLLLMLKSI